MRHRSHIIHIVIVAFATLAFAPSADAQLGGLIKKKVKEAIKPPEKAAPQPQPEAPAPAASPAAAPSNSRDPFAGQRVPNARALIITDAMLARIARGLDAERALIKDYEKQLARFPTPAQFEACRNKAAMTPEGQRFLNPGNFIKEGMKPDELQAAMMRMTTESDAYFSKACRTRRRRSSSISGWTSSSCFARSRNSGKPSKASFSLRATSSSTARRRRKPPIELS